MLFIDKPDLLLWASGLILLGIAAGTAHSLFPFLLSATGTFVLFIKESRRIGARPWGTEWSVLLAVILAAFYFPFVVAFNFFGPLGL